jgi:hypothetical protein
VVNYLERIAEKRPLADVLLISPSGASGGDKPFTLKIRCASSEKTSRTEPHGV